MNNYNSFTADKGKYNLMNPSEYETVIWFSLREDAPFARRRFQFVHKMDYGTPEDYEGMTVLEAARLCESAINRYWVNSDKDVIKGLVVYLETTDIQDQIGLLEAQLERLEKRKQEIVSQLEDLREGQS